jgi:hypothetical protein
MFRRAFVTLVVLTLFLPACSSSDDTGELEVLTDGPGAGFGDFTTGGDKTFGFFTCVNDGSVELESIEANGLEGSVELMGALVYTSSDRFVGAADGFPPEGIDEERIVDMAGSMIDIPCDDPDGNERVQLLVGLDRTGREGGQINGFTVHTSGEDVDVEYQILLCGDELEFCEGLQPTENT